MCVCVCVMLHLENGMYVCVRFLFTFNFMGTWYMYTWEIYLILLKKDNIFISSSERIVHLKERVCSLWDQMHSLIRKSTPNFRRAVKLFDRVTSPERASFQSMM